MRTSHGGVSSTSNFLSDNDRVIGPDKTTLSNYAFIGGFYQQATSAQHSMVQLLNPSGSGVYVIVDNINVSVTTAILIGLYHYDTGLTTDSGAAKSKSVGGADPSAEVRHQANASLLGTRMAAGYAPAFQPAELLRGTPIILEPGEGVVAEGLTQNIGVSAFFEWREVTT